MLTAFFPFLTSAKNIDKAQRKTQRLFRKELKKKNIHNVSLSVYSPSHQLSWEFADGERNNPETPFYTASIGKTFTATAVVLLQEEGKLDFKDKISEYLPAEIVEKLHVYKGNDYSNEITIAQLLQHTSGLPDYFEGETEDGSPNVMRQLFEHPNHIWTPEETISFTKEKMKPLFAPGTGFRYTDTEYNLLGLIIEEVSEMPLHDFFERHFFEPLQMNHTYLYFRSEPLQKTQKMSEFYTSNFKVSELKSLTADWAGGGIVSTASELNKFQSALFSGAIISKQNLARMQQWLPETKGMYYGFGLRKIVFRELFPLLPKLEIIGHFGSTASFMYYCPQLDVYLSGTLNQTEEVKNSLIFMIKILSAIRKEI